MIEPFLYQSLDRNTDQIRVLKILPGKKSNPIRCMIETVSLASSKFNFNCLSYVWGDEAEKQTILLNEKAIEVRSNLYEFLLRARKWRKIHSMPIWIDALCIDQSNLIEKGYQVQAMAQIYKSARQVFIWFGKDERKTWLWSSLLVNHYLYQAGVRTTSTTIASCSGFFARLIYHCLCLLDELHKKLLKDGSNIGLTYLDLLRKPIIRLSNNKYWSRVWIMQEVLLAQDPVAVYSNGISPLYRTIIGYRFGSTFDFTGGKDVASYKYRQLLRSALNQQCAYPRDRLFAIRGLLHEDETERISVDYTANIIDIFFGQAYTSVCRAQSLWDLLVVNDLGTALNVEVKCFCSHEILAYVERYHPEQAAAYLESRYTTQDNARSAKDGGPNEDYTSTYYVMARPTEEERQADFLSGMTCSVVTGGIRCNAILKDTRTLWRIEDRLSTVHLTVFNNPRHIAFGLTRLSAGYSMAKPVLAPSLDLSRINIDVDHLFEYQHQALTKERLLLP